MSPRPRQDHLRRPEILDAAVDAVRERGFHRVRLSDVSRRLGVTKAMPLYYWDSKDELLEDALMHGDERFWSALVEELRKRPTPSAQLEYLLYRCSFLDTVNGIWPIWIELWSRALRSPKMASAHRRLEQHLRDLLGEILREGRERGEFEFRDLEAAVSAISALVDGAAIQLVLEDAAMPPERMQRILLEVTGQLLGATLSSGAEQWTRTEPGAAAAQVPIDR